MKRLKNEKLQQLLTEFYEAIQNQEVMKSSQLMNEILPIIEQYEDESVEARLFWGMTVDYDMMMDGLFEEADAHERMEDDRGEWY